MLSIDFKTRNTSRGVLPPSQRHAAPNRVTIVLPDADTVFFSAPVLVNPVNNSTGVRMLEQGGRLRLEPMIPEPALLPEEPDFRFEVEQLDFGAITHRLLEYERQFGFSTVELVRRERLGIIEGNKDLEEWFGTFFLYLGLPEVKTLVSV